MAKAPNVSRSHSWKEPSTASSPGNTSLTWPGTVEAALCRHGGRGRFFPVLVLGELTHASVTLHSCRQAAPREAGCGAEQMGPRQQRASKLGCLGMISLRPDEEGPLGPSCLAQMIFAFPELHLKFGYDFCAKTNCAAKKLVAQFQQRPHPTQHPENVHQMQSHIRRLCQHDMSQDLPAFTFIVFFFFFTFIDWRLGACMCGQRWRMRWAGEPAGSSWALFGSSSSDPKTAPQPLCSMEDRAGLPPARSVCKHTSKPPYILKTHTGPRTTSRFEPPGLTPSRWEAHSARC